MPSFLPLHSPTTTHRRIQTITKQKDFGQPVNIKEAHEGKLAFLTTRQQHQTEAERYIFGREFRNRPRHYDKMTDIVCGLINLRITGSKGLIL